jgi:Fe-S-cluster containining protein
MHPDTKHLDLKPINIQISSPFFMITNDVCKECGLCCKREHIDIFSEEYALIKPFLKKPLVKAGLKNCFGPYESWLLSDGNGCPLLGEKGCKLPYKLRPFPCRIYPYHFKRIGDDPVFLRTNQCPEYEHFRKSAAVAHELNLEWKKLMKLMDCPTKEILLI